MNAPRAAHPLAAVGLTLAMTAAFATLDSFVRALGAVLPLAAVVGWRYATQALVMGVWLGARGGRRRFHSTRPGFQALRGGLLLATSAIGFVALRRMPLAEFTAVMLLGPVFVTLLAGAMLGERVSALRWALVVGGLVGALVVLRPGSGLFGWAALLPVTGALFYALFQVLTRKYALVEDPYATHFWTGAVGTALMLPIVLHDAPRIGPALAALGGWHAAALVAAGLLGTAGHLMLVLAARLAPASTLMPYIYAQLGFATLVGWLLFGQLPDGWGWAGIAVIGACGAASAGLAARGR